MLVQYVECYYLSQNCKRKEKVYMCICMYTYIEIDIFMNIDIYLNERSLIISGSEKREDGKG